MTYDDFKELVLFKCIDTKIEVRYIAVDGDGGIIASYFDMVSSNDYYWDVDYNNIPPQELEKRLDNNYYDDNLGNVNIPENINWKDTKFMITT